MKTPLASILGTITALRSFGALYDDATREEMLATAQEEAERLDRFLDNLLDMTRLEAGALGPKREPVDVADAVGSALRRTSRLLAGHRVATDLAADLPLVRLDFVLLEQVLVNLLENAARYTPKGGTVEIAGRAGAEAFVLEVRDRGPGIAPDEALRVFDPFYRVVRRGAGQGRGPRPRRGQGLCRGDGRDDRGPGAPGRRRTVPAELPGRADRGRRGRGAGACLIAPPPCWSSTTSRRSSAS